MHGREKTSYFSPNRLFWGEKTDYFWISSKNNLKIHLKISHRGYFFRELRADFAEIRRIGGIFFARIMRLRAICVHTHGCGYVRPAYGWAYTRTGLRPVRLGYARMYDVHDVYVHWCVLGVRTSHAHLRTTHTHPLEGVGVLRTYVRTYLRTYVRWVY